MNGNRYLLDTCFILGLYQGNPDAINLMADVSLNQCAVSIISEIELLGFPNISPDDEKELGDFLQNMTIFGLSQEIKQKTITLRKSHKIKLPDCLILATALVEKRQLLTLDNGLLKKYQAQI